MRGRESWTALRGRSRTAYAQKTKPGSTEGRPKHGVVKVGEVQRRTNQQHKILSDRKARRSNGALQRQATTDTAQDVL